MEKFKCPICGHETDFEDDLCYDCGDQWAQYHAECKTFGINPTRDGFVEAGNDPEIWDHMI
jgi:hypothetical protein